MNLFFNILFIVIVVSFVTGVLSFLLYFKEGKVKRIEDLKNINNKEEEVI